jgi:hypothetical protein
MLLSSAKFKLVADLGLQHNGSVIRFLFLRLFVFQNGYIDYSAPV